MVLSLQDGLVTSIGLCAGMAASSNHDILVAGRSMIVASALSMASGELQSTETQADVLRGTGEATEARDLGSPWLAALVSALTWPVGALVPLLAYIAFSASLALPVAVLSALVASVCVGALVSRYAGTPAQRGALRAFLLTGTAIFATWALGKAG